ncbi:MAG TPA: ribonuclease P protein component [Ktedonobacterales bacterium]|nr:ribonuclease P protein component [Ktedonobacterales bacterium]
MSHLRSPEDFQRVRRTGKRRQGRYLMLCFAPGTAASGAGVAPPRVGFSVSKRVGNAVRRNQVKRRLREVIRRRLWNVTPGWDMIVIARPEAGAASYDALRDDIDTLLAQARLLRVPVSQGAAITETSNRTASETTSENKSETHRQ